MKTPLIKPPLKVNEPFEQCSNCDKELFEPTEAYFRYDDDLPLCLDCYSDIGDHIYEMVKDEEK